MSCNNLVLKEQTHTTVLVTSSVAYCTNPTKFKIADTTNGRDLLLEREIRIKTDTYVASCAGKFEVRTLQIYGLWNRVRVENRLCSNKNH